MASFLAGKEQNLRRKRSTLICSWFARSKWISILFVSPFFSFQMYRSFAFFILIVFFPTLCQLSLFLPLFQIFWWSKQLKDILFMDLIIRLLNWQTILLSSELVFIISRIYYVQSARLEELNSWAERADAFETRFWRNWIESLK